MIGAGYGVATAAIGTAAAISTILLGLVLVRREQHPYGEGLVVVGVALLLPPPLAWVIAAVAWTGIGLRIATETEVAAPRGVP